MLKVEGRSAKAWPDVAPEHRAAVGRRRPPRETRHVVGHAELRRASLAAGDRRTGNDEQRQIAIDPRPPRRALSHQTEEQAR